ncbi:MULTISPECIES: bestrophin-like domain [Cupriavidus]
MIDISTDVFNFIPYSWRLLLWVFGVLLCASTFGALLVKQMRNPETRTSDDVRMVLGATLTLLGLAIGFSYSMAISGYNTRQANESAEAGAIGLAYAKADLLPAENAARLKTVLQAYVGQRILFYAPEHADQVEAGEKRAASLRREAWNVAIQGALPQPNSLTALAAASIGDVQSAYERTASAWRKQIPSAAWGLMIMLAIFCNMLIGYSAGARGHRGLLIVFPLVIAVCLALVNDIDVPGHGLIHIGPDNLRRVAAELAAMTK